MASAPAREDSFQLERPEESVTSATTADDTASEPSGRSNNDSVEEPVPVSSSVAVQEAHDYSHLYILGV
jgi:hypothetical protein